MANYTRVESSNKWWQELNQKGVLKAPNQQAVDAFKQQMSSNPINNKQRKGETPLKTNKPPINAKQFYDKLSQKQHSKVLAGIRNDLEVELLKVKKSINQAEFGSKEWLNLSLDHERLSRLLLKYGPASVVSQGVTVSKTLASRIPNGFGAGVRVVNRIMDLSNLTVTGFVYRNPYDGQYHAGFNAFDHKGNGNFFGGIDGL